MTSPARELDYLAHLARESDRFALVMAATPAGVPVPPCPDWSADDLLWHLGEVQWFWGTIVREGLDGAAAEARKPARPGDRDGLAAFYARASADLRAALAALPPEAAAWTWSDDQTVGFVRRRQAHEALIHRVDAELTAGQRTAMDPELSADGVDEALRIMYGADLPEWGTFTPDARARTVQVLAIDTGDAWQLALGRFTGTSPDGTSYDQAAFEAIEAAPGGTASARIAGGAADLDCLLWHRPPCGQVDRSGDAGALSGFDAVIAEGID